MKRYVWEIFDEFKKAPTIEEKVAVLRKYGNDTGLRTVLRATFHPQIHFIVEGVPHYKPNPYPTGFNTTTIDFEAKRLYLFEKNHPRIAPGFTQQQRNRILIEILESLDKNDAVIFMNMLLKDQKVPDLSREIVEQALPGLTHG